MGTKAPESENLLEMAAEIMRPAKWAAMQLVKGGRPDMTVGEAMDMIEATVERAIEMALKAKADPQVVFANDDELTEVMVKVPVSVTVTAPRRVAEAADANDLRQIVDSAIQRDFPVTVALNGEPVACVIGPHWDDLPEDEMEAMSTESGMWGEES